MPDIETAKHALLVFKGDKTDPGAILMAGTFIVKAASFGCTTEHMLASLDAAVRAGFAEEITNPASYKLTEAGYAAVQALTA